MLYITTRDDKDAYTTARTLNMNYAPDGGQFVPFKLPELDQSDIQAMANNSFGQTVADVLNLFFSARLTGWDIDFCIGRNPLKIVSMSHKLLITELWHNPEDSYEYIENAVFHRICPDISKNCKPTDWVKIAVRISVLIGIYAQLLHHKYVEISQPMDIAVAADDFSATVAVWYARKMGLPVGAIVCSFTKDSPAWDLIHHGQANTSGCTLPVGLERLIQGTLGCGENRRFLDISNRGGIYSVDETLRDLLGKDMFPAVVGAARIDSIIGSMYNTNAYVIDPNTAQAYGGLQDYRASVGENRPALLISENSPRFFRDRISGIIGISADKIG